MNILKATDKQISGRNRELRKRSTHMQTLDIWQNEQCKLVRKTQTCKISGSGIGWAATYTKKKKKKMEIRPDSQETHTNQVLAN